MKSILLFLIFTCITMNGFSQKTYVDKNFGFSIAEPKKWIIKNNSLFLDSLFKANSDIDTAELIDENNGSLLLAKFQKYSDNQAGFIPVVEINLLNNQTLSFDDFLEDIKASSQQLKSQYKNFVFINEAKAIDINGYKAISFDGNFSLTGTKNVVIEVSRLKAKTTKNYEILLHTKVYAIPIDKYFLQLSLTTEVDRKDDELVLEQFINSLKIEK